ncbi:MAG: hypothetical protein A2505_05595 [Deltaproteobacteria bacterium RIFOXYD12_FULL_55_16]|nr:MAG: hypothetical protein A2505_05595 [Deltaproteobacteria bacterium RIFOXYD12_FULL_55_16]
MNIGFFERGYLPIKVVRLAADILTDYGGKLADIACGKGVLLKEVEHHGNKSVIGIDLAPDQLAISKANGMTVVRGSIFEMPFKDGKFDISVCFNTLYNFLSLSTLEPVFREMARIIRMDGKIVIDIRNNRNILLNIKYWLHMKRGKHPTISHSLEEINALMEQNGCSLAQKKAVGFNNPYIAWGYILIYEKKAR